MNTRRSLLPSGLLLLAFLAGCAPRGGTLDNPFRGGSGATSVRLFVTNLNFMDATLWAVTPGTREKLGVVTGKREAVYTIPWDFSTELWLEIDMLAGDRCITAPLPVDPGDHLELVIDVDMSRSPLCRNRRGDGDPA